MGYQSDDIAEFLGEKVHSALAVFEDLESPDENAIEEAEGLIIDLKAIKATIQSFITAINVLTENNNVLAKGLSEAMELPEMLPDIDALIDKLECAIEDNKDLSEETMQQVQRREYARAIGAA